jgi:hypothetical protein
MMTAQNKARIAAIASIILTHLVTLLGTSDRPPRFRDSFIEPAEWLRGARLMLPNFARYG